MFWIKKYKIKREKRENEEKLRKLHGREVRYASRRDSSTYTEMVIGKNGIIDVKNDLFSLIFNNKIVFSSHINDLSGSDLMSLDGIILTRINYDSGIGLEDKIVVYYKYHRRII